MRRKEGCVQLVESHQDSTEWERDNFSGWKSKYTCGRKEIGCCEGPGEERTHQVQHYSAEES